MLRRRTTWATAVAVVLWGAASVAVWSSGGGGGNGGGGSEGGRPAPAGDGAVVPGDEWVVAAPEAHGIDPAVLEQAREYAFADGMNTQGVVVVHDGVIVAEWYADVVGSGSWAASWAVAKGFASALVGIAIDDGLIPGVDEPMTTWFPEWQGTDKAAITLRGVLQSTSGLQWVEDYDLTSTEVTDIVQLVLNEADQLAYAASRPLAHEPGTVWNYSSGDAMLLSRVLEQSTGMPVYEYAEQELFGPLDIERAEWWRDARGHTLTYCCLDATSRAFARLGLLYARGGTWGDRQLVPAGWVAESLEPAPDSDGAYGYQWWLDPADGVPDDAFAAVGHDGQYVYVIPSLDLVVVRNGLYVKDPGPPVADSNLISRYPPDGLVPGRGTINPQRPWDDSAFLRPIITSLDGD